MSLYRKKPERVKAFRLISDNVQGMAEWCNGYVVEQPPLAIIFSTPEGPMAAYEGDWIIRGASGEFRPCKPEIFAMTYEAME